MIKTGVIGHPINHSKSPLIHNYWFQKHKISGVYESIDIRSEDLKTGIQGLIEQGYSGFNVTIPHKETMIELCHEIDETAQTIGAVNTVTIINNQLKGTNTDAFGFIENIKHTQPHISFKNKTAYILGAGGATKAIIYGLVQQNISRIIITNRTKEKAQNVAQHFTNLMPLEVVDWDKKESSLCESDVLINATSLGMNGQPPLDLNLQNLPKTAIVCDIVYAPLMTPLLKQAQQNGHPITTGIGMLLHQARPGFQLWTGIMPSVDKTLQTKILS